MNRYIPNVKTKIVTWVVPGTNPLQKLLRYTSTLETWLGWAAEQRLVRHAYGCILYASRRYLFRECDTAAAAASAATQRRTIPRPPYSLHPSVSHSTARAGDGRSFSRFAQHSRGQLGQRLRAQIESLYVQDSERYQCKWNRIKVSDIIK